MRARLERSDESRSPYGESLSFCQKGCDGNECIQGDLRLDGLSEDGQRSVTCRQCGGIRKYHADGAKLSKETFSSYSDAAATAGRISRSAVTGGMAWLGQASFQTRLSPPAPFGLARAQPRAPVGVSRRSSRRSWEC